MPATRSRSGAGGRRHSGGWWSTTTRRSSRSDPRRTGYPASCLVASRNRRPYKNRLHLDFRPDDRDAAVARILDLGATRADVGQGEQSWIVLSDPEGNEFCVLSSRDR